MAHARLDIIKPLRYNDYCIVTMGVGRLGTTSFNFVYELFSKLTGALAARGHVVMVTYDHATESKIPIPDSMRQSLSRFQVEWE